MFSLTLRKLAIAVAAAGVFASPAAASLDIQIPRLHLKVPLNYVSQDPSPLIYYQDSDTLGIAGHRVTHTRPFYYIDTLRIGDAIYVDYGKYRNKYVVRKIYPQVPPSAVRSLVRQSGIILSACTPRHFATYRYVVVGKLVSVRKR